MEIKITLFCPTCSGTNIIKNGKKQNSKQNYLCKNCGKQFIGDHALSYKGCHSKIKHRIELMLVRGVGIRDIAEIESISIKKTLSVLTKSKKIFKPKNSHYSALEVDEFWTYVGNKKNKVWLIYAYHRETGEIVAWVWGKRNLKTARSLRKKIRDLGITYDTIYTDNWKSFVTTFNHRVCS